MKNRIFYIGLLLICISFIACVMSFYLLVFGIPVFIIGAILVFLSKQTIISKLLTTLIPIIIYIPTTFLFLHIYNYSTPKTILIPASYEGPLRVVYEEKCGKNYGEMDGEKMLKFPENGILILNEDFDQHINYHYYLIDKFGNKTKIPQILDFENKINKMPCVLVGDSGTMGQTIEANSTNQENKGITFSDFYVFNKDTVYRDNFKHQQKFDSLTRILVNQCRLR